MKNLIMHSIILLCLDDSCWPRLFNRCGSNSPACCAMRIPTPSFPHAFSGNPGETLTGPPIKTFGGDDFGETLINVFLIPQLTAGSFIRDLSGPGLSCL